jgi:hypothetical protein
MQMLNEIQETRPVLLLAYKLCKDDLLICENVPGPVWRVTRSQYEIREMRRPLRIGLRPYNQPVIAGPSRVSTKSWELPTSGHN